MYINHNILDSTVINNILHNSEFNKDLNYQELINILNNITRYSTIYTIQNRILHITDNEGICYYDINISVKNKIIIINIQNEKNNKISIIHVFNYTEKQEEIHELLISKYSYIK